MSSSGVNPSDIDMDLEAQLRDALRPVAPSDAFTQALLAKLSARSARASSARESHRSQAAGRGLPPTRDGERVVRLARRVPGWWLTASLAASLLVAVGAVQHLRAEHERARGLEARREVIEALRVTNQKLDLAYRVVRSQSSAMAEGDSGV